MTAVAVGARITLVDPDSGATVGGVVVDARGPEWPADLDPRPGGYVGDPRGDWFGITFDDCPGHVEPVNESDFRVVRACSTCAGYGTVSAPLKRCPACRGTGKEAS